VFAFDCLYHNGVSLLHEPLTKRRGTLHASIKEVPGQVTQATTKISNDVEELEVRGTEGGGVMWLAWVPDAGVGWGGGGGRVAGRGLPCSVRLSRVRRSRRRQPRSATRRGS
jgi:hypothetical protein